MEVWRYYGRLLVRIPCLLWNGTDRVASVTTVALIILVYILPHFTASLVGSSWSAFAYHWAWVLVVCLAIWGLGKANYEQIKNRDEQIKTLKMDVQNLSAKLENRTNVRALRKAINDSIGTGNRLARELSDFRTYNEMIHVYDKIKGWIRETYYLLDQPPLHLSSVLVAGLGIEREILGEETSQTKEIRSVMQYAEAEQERTRLDRCITQVITNLHEAIRLLPLE